MAPTVRSAQGPAAKCVRSLTPKKPYDRPREQAEEQIEGLAALFLESRRLGLHILVTEQLMHSSLTKAQAKVLHSARFPLVSPVLCTMDSVSVAPSRLSAVAISLLLCAQAVCQPSLLILVHSAPALSSARPSPQPQLCWSSQRPQPLFVCLQEKVEALTVHPMIVEVLQPPRTRTRMGTWLLAAELLLEELAPNDLSASLHMVLPAAPVFCRSSCPS